MTVESLWTSPGIDEGTVREIERLAARAWPAERNIPLASWLCRRTTDSSTQRANSVLALDPCGPGFDPIAAVDRVIAIYDEMGGISRFQISPATQPPELDRILDERGFRLLTPTHVMGISVGPANTATRADVTISAAADHAWRQAFERANPLPGETGGRLSIMARAGGDGVVGYASVPDETGAVAALGAGVVPTGGDAAMIFGMHTFAPARRKGFGSRILAGLTAWALEFGCAKVYLQVDADNRDAIGLYERRGFRRLYGYHYRALIRANKVG